MDTINNKKWRQSTESMEADQVNANLVQDAYNPKKHGKWKDEEPSQNEH